MILSQTLRRWEIGIKPDYFHFNVKPNFFSISEVTKSQSLQSTCSFIKGLKDITLHSKKLLLYLEWPRHSPSPFPSFDVVHWKFCRSYIVTFVLMFWRTDIQAISIWWLCSLKNNNLRFKFVSLFPGTMEQIHKEDPPIGFNSIYENNPKKEWYWLEPFDIQIILCFMNENKYLIKCVVL